MAIPYSLLPIPYSLNKYNFYKYSEICKEAEELGSLRTLLKMFNRSNDCLVLLQDPKKMTSGHWLSVSRKPEKREIYFFSTYGGKPDREKISWMDTDDLKKSGQQINIFNDAMKELQSQGWEIHYNNYPYQKEGDHTATCGIYTSAFLRSGLNPDQFKAQTLEIKKSGKNPAIVYYNRYFV